ncbi:hypothetical protein K7432_013942 [Basidiobolus ranarum]|uniref:Uncharacterized protein n=1 Tax=Basidiobolus ranarum TaxID=34480 RepID=A0ABR2WIE4_9FUNG
MMDKADLTSKEKKKLYKKELRKRKRILLTDQSSFNNAENGLPNKLAEDLLSGFQVTQDADISDVIGSKDTIPTEILINTDSVSKTHVHINVQVEKKVEIEKKEEVPKRVIGCELPPNAVTKRPIIDEDIDFEHTKKYRGFDTNYVAGSRNSSSPESTQQPHNTESSQDVDFDQTKRVHSGLRCCRCFELLVRDSDFECHNNTLVVRPNKLPDNWKGIQRRGDRVFCQNMHNIGSIQRTTWANFSVNIYHLKIDKTTYKENFLNR